MPFELRRIEGDLEPGSYSGTVDLNPADEDKGTVDLTVNVAKCWLIAFLLVPILVLGIGPSILAALRDDVRAVNIHDIVQSGKEPAFLLTLAFLRVALGARKGWSRDGIIELLCEIAQAKSLDAF